MSSPLRWWQDPRIIETKKRGQSLSREKVTGGGEGCAAVASLFRLTSLPALPPLPACSASRRCQLCRQVQFVCTTSRRDSEPEMDTLSSPTPLLALLSSPGAVGAVWIRSITGGGTRQSERIMPNGLIFSHFHRLVCAPGFTL
jgi:hypothetical protein